MDGLTFSNDPLPMMLVLAVCACRGIVLKDLVAIDSQGKDFISAEHLNLAKYRLLWTTLCNINSAQKRMDSLQGDTDHMRILRVSELYLWLEASTECVCVCVCVCEHVCVYVSECVCHINSVLTNQFNKRNFVFATGHFLHRFN